MAEANPNPQKHKVSNIPQADIDFRDVSKKVAQSWLATPQLTLIWTTQGVFSSTVNNYSTTLDQRKTAGGTRPEVTQKLKTMDHNMDADIEHIKGYLSDKYTKKNAPSYYAEFGIVKAGETYKLPHDHNKRKAGLNMLLGALTVHGFQGNTYGLTYWTDVYTKFDALLTQSVSIDGTVADKVGIKKVLKAQIKKTLNALIDIIIGNYPDTYKAVLRNWGFQKEKY
jgi:effector-binding domain-containing protein